MPVERALGLLSGIAAGLAAAHDVGVVHRDLKPANVIVRDDGVPVLVDFGISLLAGGGEGEHRERAPVEGTLDWMAPEHAAGEEARPAADVWAAGVILFQLLTGEHPFAGATPMERLGRMLAGKPRELRRLRPELPASVERLVAGCLERDPSRRIRSGRELLQRIPVSRLPVAAATPRLWSAEVVVEASVHRPLGRGQLLASLATAAAGVAAVAWLAVAAWGPVRRPWLAPAEALALGRSLAERAGALPSPVHGAAGLAPGPTVWVRLSPASLLDPDRPPGPSWPPPHRPGEVRLLLTASGDLLRWDWWPDGHRRVDREAVLAAFGGGPGKRGRARSAGVDPRGLRLEAVRLGDGSTVLLAPSPDGPVVATREGVAPPPEPERLTSPAASLLLLALVVAATVAAWRRWRAREADVAGAVTLAAATVALHWVKLLANPVTLISGIWLDQTLVAAGAGVVLAVAYAGLEPVVRASWPGAMASWLRLLHGRAAHPEVAREVAVGAASVLAVAAAVAAAALAAPLPPPGAATLGAGSWGLWVFALATQAERGVILSLLVLLGAAALSRLVHHPWIALGAAGAVLGPGLLWPGATGGARAALVVAGAVLVPAVVRVGGALSLAVMVFASGCAAQALPAAAGAWTLPFTASAVAVAAGPAMVAPLLARRAAADTPAVSRR